MNEPPLETVDGIPDYLDGSEHVVLYPTFGHLSADGLHWLVGIAGAVYRPAVQNLRRRMMIRLVMRLMRASPDERTRPTFLRRVDGFLIKTRRGRRLAVRFDDRLHWLQRPSKRNGHFRGSIRLPRVDGDRLKRESDGAGGWIPVQVAVPHHDPREFSGQVQLIEPRGVSVISDIDDTIKSSEVADRRRLLQNTFLHPFEAVPGMAALYGKWAQQGAAFHYVSSSPWQLFEDLQEFLVRAQFPSGSFHLRAIRLRDPSILRLFVARRATKRKAIRSILRMFPERRFVLLGDSGEKDPEIYGAMSRQFPRQVKQIFIRRIPGTDTSPERWQKAFRQLPSQLGRLFDDPSELAEWGFPE